MNIRAVKEKELKGTLSINAAKSDVIRRLLLAAFSFNKCEVRNIGKSDDVIYTLNAIYTLGAQVIKTHEGFLFELKNIYETEIDVGESAFLLRSMIAILSTLGVRTRIKMGDQLRRRPHNELIDALNKVGANISIKNEYVNVEGKADLSDISINCDKSSQYVSALLLAGAIKGTAKIRVLGQIASAGYIGLTRKALTDFGVRLTLTNNNEINILGRPHAEVIYCDNDYSSAAPFLAIGAYGDVTIDNLRESLQPDQKILQALTQMGAKVEKGNGVRVSKQDIKTFSFDCFDCPDIGPLVACMMALIDGECVLTGIENLRIKESDRLTGLINAFSSIGVKTEYTKDKLVIHGGSIHDGIINAQCDHRLVMAFCVLSILSGKNIEIKNAEGIRKSNPDFFVMLNSVGCFAEML